jgi:hypothetical protein
MNLLRLLADAMRGLLEFPMRLIQGLKTWRQQRLMIQLSTRDVGKEVQEARGIKGFFKKLGKIFLIIVAFILLGLFFWGLYALSNYLDLPRMLGGPLPWLRPFWLPILVVLFGVTFWLALRLWGLLGPEKDTNAFPDLDAAWAEAEAALVQAGISVRDVPLFLMLGKPFGSIDAIFSSSKITWLVRQTPLRVDAPFQVYAHRQAIFVALGEHSVLGKVLEQLGKGLPGDEPLPTAKTSVFHDEPTTALEIASAPALVDPLATPNLLAEELAPRNRLASIDAGPRVPTLEERNAKQLQSRWQPLSPEAVDLTRRRTNAMIRIIAKYRRPFCAANGVLVVVPHNGLSNATDAGQIAAALDDDLRIVAKAGQTRCPSWLLVADLHTIPGFDALFRSLDQERRQRLLGRDLPFQPDLAADAVDAMATSAIASFLASLSLLAQKLFMLETSHAGAAQAILTNGKLFELIEHLEQRRAGLEIVIRRIIHGNAPDGLYFGGFYLAATGADPQSDQAFVPGVFRLMVDHQNKVAWTDEALEEEADYQRWAVFGYAAMGAFCLLLVVLGYWRWHGVG